MKLPAFDFLSRFRLRVVLQNKAAYCVLLIGIFLANVMMLFGLFLPPALENYADQITESQIADYQYVLKAPVETDTKGAEKYAVNTLRIEGREDVMVYGISKKSDYIKDIDLPEKKNEILISKGIHEKYGVGTGDTLELKAAYGKKVYKFKVRGMYDYPAALSVFMPRRSYEKVFDTDKGFFNGYFSDRKIKDIDDEYIATTITLADLTTVSDQLMDSMGGLMPLFTAFASIVYVLLIYLLAKMIVDRNSASISMLKILGYTNGEAAKIYNNATAFVVGGSLLISLPASLWVMHSLYGVYMSKINGWVTYYMAPWVICAVPLIGVVCYALIHVLLTRKVRKIDLAASLKDME